MYKIEEEALIQNESNWLYDRRKWLKMALLGGIALSSPWIISCDSDVDEKTPNLDGNGILTKGEMKVLFSLQNTLFPKTPNSPSASEINAHQFFVWMMSDPHFPQSEKDYYLEKLQQFKTQFEEEYEKSFDLGSELEQTKFIEININESWFQGFLSRMITIIFEATLLDPIYGGNTDELGWQWLEHIPGSPRPNSDNKYPQILHQLRASIS